MTVEPTAEPSGDCVQSEDIVFSGLNDSYIG